MAYSTENMRNLVLVGQQGSGKTTLVEAILYHTGVINKLGSVTEGNTVCDYDWLEKQKGFTINPSLVYTRWEEKKINLIDTPGFPELVEKVRPILKVTETALVIASPDTISGSGIKRTLRYLREEKLPYLVFLNKIETKQADFSKILNQLEQQLGIKPVPLTYPMMEGQKLVGLIDIIEMKGKIYKQGKAEQVEIPEQLKPTANQLREKLMEATAEISDEFIEKYLEEGELTPEQIKQGLKKGISDVDIVPLLTGSAVEGIGIDLLLDILTGLFPSPMWRRKIKATATQKQDEEVEIKIGPQEPLCTQVFLTLFEPHLGEVSFIKVFSGALSSGGSIYNANKKEVEKIGQIYLMQGNNREETPELTTGDIGALTKLKSVETGDTFCSQTNSIILSPPPFPEANTSIALKPKNEKDEQRLSVALSRLMKVDPLLKVEVNKESGQTILSGRGEIHLDLIINRINKDFNVEVETEQPQIPYREAITQQAEAQGRYKRQSGGRGQYGDVWLRIKPLPRGEGFRFVDEIKGGAVPARFIPSVEKGVKETMKKGGLAHCPMVDMEVTLFDGSYHSVDSSDIAFQIAASMGVRKAVDAASPILLEPIMEIEVETPSECMGDVNGDLSSRRGRILEVQPLEGRDKIKAHVPLAQLRNYSTILRSITQGRGMFSQKFSHYEKTPDEIAQRIIEAKKAKKEG